MRAGLKAHHLLAVDDAGQRFGQRGLFEAHVIGQGENMPSLHEGARHIHQLCETAIGTVAIGGQILADVAGARLAMAARAAGQRRAKHHTLPLGEKRCVLRVDDTGELMAEDGGKADASCLDASVDPHVGAADGGGLDADGQPPGPRNRIGHRFEAHPVRCA